MSSPKGSRWSRPTASRSASVCPKRASRASSARWRRSASRWRASYRPSSACGMEARMYRYFAYGSAISKRHIGEWAAEHGVDARLFARGAPALLRGYRLVFDVESRFWGGRVADLAEDEDGLVHGVLFEIPLPAKEAVLRKEGVATGLSEEIDVFVEAEGKRISAKAYVARPEKRGEEGPASGR